MTKTVVIADSIRNPLPQHPGFRLEAGMTKTVVIADSIRNPLPNILDSGSRPE